MGCFIHLVFWGLLIGVLLTTANQAHLPLPFALFGLALLLLFGKAAR